MKLLRHDELMQDGDEYREGGEWHPVTDKDINVLVSESGYDLVRRPDDAADAEQKSRFKTTASYMPSVDLIVFGYQWHCEKPPTGCGKLNRETEAKPGVQCRYCGRKYLAGDILYSSTGKIWRTAPDRRHFRLL
jgi:hypothetical protein